MKCDEQCDLGIGALKIELTIMLHSALLTRPSSRSAQYTIACAG